MALITQGQRFERWTALEDQRYTFVRKVAVKCDCGKKSKVNVNNLAAGLSRSCGCLNRELLAATARKRLQHPVNPGDVFERLTVVDATDRNKVQCSCICGNTTTTRASALYRGNTRSCGCIKRETAVKLGKSSASQGGISCHTLFGTWQRLITNPVPLHEPWRDNPALFIAEVEAAIGPRPKGLRLTMKNAKLGYLPGNVEWGIGKLHPNQKVSLTPQQRLEVAELIHSGMTQRAVAQQYGISHSLTSVIYREYRYGKQ